MLKDNTATLINRNIFKQTKRGYQLRPFKKLFDFTELSLYLTNAISPSYFYRKKVPMFLKECMKKLDKALSKYQEDSYLLNILQVKYDKNEIIEIEFHYEMRELEVYISKYITWDSARKLIKEVILTSNVNQEEDIIQQTILPLVNDLYKDGFKKINRIDFKPSTLTKVELFVLFKFAVAAAFEELQTEMLRQLIQASQDYTNLPMDKKSSKKDKPLGNPIE